jgi:hypothetical protein
MNFSKTEESENESGRDLFARLLSQKSKPQNENNSNDKMPFSQVKSQSNPAIIHELEKILHISKPFNLDQTILPNSIANHDIIEIFGRIGTGKSELLMHFMSRCLLPPKWRIPKKKNPNQSDQVDYIGKIDVLIAYNSILLLNKRENFNIRSRFKSMFMPRKQCRVRKSTKGVSRSNRCQIKHRTTV